jgi:hypothetical protein
MGRAEFERARGSLREVEREREREREWWEREGREVRREKIKR